jgi:hypothetical protein
MKSALQPDRSRCPSCSRLLASASRIRSGNPFGYNRSTEFVNEHPAKDASPERPSGAEGTAALSISANPYRYNTSTKPRISVNLNDFNPIRYNTCARSRIYLIPNDFKSIRYNTSKIASARLKTKDLKSTRIIAYAIFPRNPTRINTSTKARFFCICRVVFPSQNAILALPNPFDLETFRASDALPGPAIYNLYRWWRPRSATGRGESGIQWRWRAGRVIAGSACVEAGLSPAAA